MDKGSAITITKCGPTIMAELSAGDLHTILLHAHRVVVFNDDGGWFAQGLDIDHFAQGDTQESAIGNYTESFEWMIQEHLDTYKSLRHIRVPAPKEIWTQAGNAEEKLQLSHLATYEVKVEDKVESLIGFYTPVMVPPAARGAPSPVAA